MSVRWLNLNLSGQATNREIIVNCVGKKVIKTRKIKWLFTTNYKANTIITFKTKTNYALNSFY